MILNTEYQYFGCVNWLKKIALYSHIKFELCDRHPKLSYRNRTIISGANGPIVLSIPIVGGRDQKSITKEVRVNYSENWPIQHWRAIESSYRKAPFFDFYADAVKALITTKHEFLWQLDAATFNWLVKVMKLKLTVSHTEAFVYQLPQTEEDARYSFRPGDKKAVDTTKKYSQVFEDRFGFLPDLSVLDLLFCCGPQAQDFLS